MSPLKVLTRGYAMAENNDGTVIRSVKQTGEGETLKLTVSDGQIRATVLETKENPL